MKQNIHVRLRERITEAARSKVRVRVTARTRSPTGFSVETPDAVIHTATKIEALQCLLAHVRTAPIRHYTIEAAEPGQLSIPLQERRPS